MFAIFPASSYVLLKLFIDRWSTEVVKKEILV